MTDFPDRRSRYIGHGPSEFAPGAPRVGNIQIGHSRTELARRHPVSPSACFRDVTAPKPPAPIVEEVKPAEPELDSSWLEI